MKKSIGFILIICILISVVGCAEKSNNSDGTNNTATTSKITSEENNNRTQMTLDNYTKYIKISGHVRGVSKEVSIGISAQPLSENFNYNDIEITLTIKGKYRADSAKISDPTINDTFNIDSKITLDISGKCVTNIHVLELPEYYTVNAIYSEYTNCEIIVTGISGSVTPA